MAEHKIRTALQASDTLPLVFLYLVKSFLVQRKLEPLILIIDNECTDNEKQKRDADQDVSEMCLFNHVRFRAFRVVAYESHSCLDV